MFGVHHSTVFRGHGHAAGTAASGGKDRIADGGGKTHEAGFAGASGRQILAIEEHDFDFGGVAESGHAVLGEVGVEDTAVGEEDLLEERAADALDDGAAELVA